MFNGIFKIPQPANEPVRDHAPGSAERSGLKAMLKEMLSAPIDVPMIIGGKEIRNGKTVEIMLPTRSWANHWARITRATHCLFTRRSMRPTKRKKNGADMPWDSRAIVLLKAAELLAGKYRQTLNAATMLNMSKTPHQAEIDSACELIDFWRFNPHFMEEVYGDQPLSAPGVLNYMEHRPLDGFVLAITPFNFTSIAGNLPTAPALMGNTVVWKPASSAVLPAYFIMKILEEAGLPPGVINMIPGPGPVIGPPALDHTRSGRHSLYRQHPCLLDHLAGRRLRYSQVRLLPADRRRNGRQGFHLCPRQLRRRRVGDGPGPRCLRVSGTEVLGRRRGRISPTRSGRGEGAAARQHRRRSRWATSPTSRNFMGAVIDQKLVLHDQGLHRVCQEQPRYGDPLRRRVRRLDRLFRRTDRRALERTQIES